MVYDLENNEEGMSNWDKFWFYLVILSGTTLVVLGILALRSM